MRQLRSYLKGTTDLLVWLERLKTQYPELPPLFSWLTMDYTAMYPSMPDNLAMPAVREYLDSRTVKTPSTDSTIRLIEAVKNKNYFTFGDTLYRQETGVSIGQKYAPPFACLGAGKLEEDKIYPSELFQKFVLDDLESPDTCDRFYTRFTDDKLAAFLGNQQQAVDFVDWLNTLWPGLKFTFEWSNKSIKFLNVEILITAGGIETNMYVKPTNPQLYLHYSSAHPPHVFKAIVYGQALNVKMICSKEE